jgi:hypothetical protein
MQQRRKQMEHTWVKGVECYGELLGDSNFAVVCEDEEEDTIWCDGNPHSPDFTFQSWEDVVDYLKTQFDSDIVEISAV